MLRDREMAECIISIFPGKDVHLQFESPSMVIGPSRREGSFISGREVNWNILTIEWPITFWCRVIAAK